jgi:dolichol-phosphate mannosyltransferase
VRPLVIVQTYKERDKLAAVTGEILAVGDLRILVVDDGSPDGTGEVADALARARPDRISVLHRSGVRGLGRSYRDGMLHALAHTTAELICQMDADLSHLPADLPRLLDAAAYGDLVIGSRYVEGGRILNWPRRRVWLSAIANHYVRRLTRLPVRDVTSGFRCWRRDMLARMPLAGLASDGYAFQVEMTWHARQAGGRIIEVPITFVERRLGQSKLSGRVLVESAILPVRLWRGWLPGNPGRGRI